MKTARLFLLPTLLLALILTSCEDQPLPTHLDPVTPDFGRYSGEQDASAQRIEALLIALFPSPGPENAALNRWANIQRQLSRGQTRAAQAQMRSLAADVIESADEGLLEAPTDPLLPPTVDGAVHELLIRLYVFVGLEVGDALDEFDDALPDDFGYGDVDEEDGGVVVTDNEWARVTVPAAAVEGTTYITIELLDEETCAGADELTKALGCWDINRYPQGDFDEEVTVEVCAADNPVLTNDEWDLLLLHRKDDNGEVSVLPWAEPSLDCEGFGSEEPVQTASLTPIESLLASFKSGMADLLLPEPLLAGAPIPRSRPPRGVGGLTGTFSEFFAAVPAGAQPDLVAWWTGDANYFEMYGGNHGEPIGDVSFVSPGMSFEAFAFGGDPSEIVITPLSQELTDLQDLTVATWVNLDPAGSPHTIQRFLTLAPEKAVLRQEGAYYRYRMLHFYMNFEEYPEFGHIRVNDAFQAGCYHFFAGTYDGEAMRAYLDGALVGEEPIPGGTVVAASDWANFSSTAEPLAGSLDEVMIFDRALDQTELQAIFDAGGEGKCGARPPGVTVYGRVRYSYVRLPDIQVELWPADLLGSPIATTTTAADGGYAFESVPPGDYQVKVYGGGEYIAWTAQPITVDDEAVHHPVQLPKNVQLLSPADGSTVGSADPTLAWTPNPEADYVSQTYGTGYYAIQINETDGWGFVDLGTSDSESSYTVQTALSEGVEYTWQVDAYDWRGRWVGTTVQPFTFTFSGAEGSWAPTGSLAAPRWDHVAVLLGDGTVLVLGGVGDTDAQLFDPGTGAFQSVGNTLYEHGQGLTATKLTDGRVLIAGGNLGGDAEIFDPVLGAFGEVTGISSGERIYHSATLLQDGRVLLAGGSYHDGEGHRVTRNDAEIFDPATGFFMPTGLLTGPRETHTGTLLPDGRVLLPGGYFIHSPGHGTLLTSADLFDPAAGGTFTSTGGMVGWGGSLHFQGAPLLPNGLVLTTGRPTAELYDYTTGTFRATAAMLQDRDAHASALLADGRVLVAGGYYYSVEEGRGIITASAEIYDPATEVFVPAASMITPRQEFQAIRLLDGRVLVMGGLDAARNPVSAAEIFTPGGG